jgi:hypothetical protein
VNPWEPLPPTSQATAGKETKRERHSWQGPTILAQNHASANNRPTSAGFVTGGGWINSPEGAYTANSSLTGKSNFGFNCKYQQGGGIPTGEIEFNFKEANLKLHGTSYEWLVISGAQATFRGEGTINGQGLYNFQVTVIDADVDENDSYHEDLFRFKIWDDSSGSEVVIYDSGFILLGGGSIKIHLS